MCARCVVRAGDGAVIVTMGIVSVTINTANRDAPPETHDARVVV